MAKSCDKCQKEQKSTSKKIIAFRILKFIVFVVCVSGFTIQARDFFNHFYSYPTVINTEVTNPDNFTAPAITLCYTSQFKRSKYCDTYPDHCRKPKNVTTFCLKKPHFCRHNDSTSTIDSRVPNRKYLEYENYVKRNNTEDLCHDVSPFVNNSRVTKYFIQTRPKYGTTRFLTYPCFSDNLRVLSELPPEIIELVRCTNYPPTGKLLQKYKDCMKQCKSECVKMSYLFTVEERNNIPTVDDEEGKGYIDVDIFIDEQEVLVRSHKPQYLNVEAFSYIGGFMGCWLGISIWAFAHNIGSVFSSVIAFLKNCLRRYTGRKSLSDLEV